MFDPKQKHSERELMDLAVRLAEKSIPENDGRSHPMVGAVISRDGYVLQTGFRGEKPNLHAEEAALEKLTAAQARRDYGVHHSGALRGSWKNGLYTAAYN